MERILEVLLREPLKTGRLIELIEHWCRRVEFPIAVDDLGNSRTIIAETPEQFVYDVQDVTEKGSRLIVRAFPINRPGIEGELYVFARVMSGAEAWDQYSWAKYRYPQMHPGAASPEFPRDLQCLHGITLDSAVWTDSGYSSRVDHRGEGPSITLARKGRDREEVHPGIASRWEEILSEHLSTSSFSISKDGWKYRQRLVNIFEFNSFWRSIDGMIPIRIDGKMVTLPLNVVESFPTITFVLSKGRVQNQTRYSPESGPPFPKTESETPLLFDDSFLSAFHCDALVYPRVPVKLYWLDEHYIAIDFLLGDENVEPFAETALGKYFLLDLPAATSTGCGIQWPSMSRTVGCLNSNHPFVKWLARVNVACTNHYESITTSQFETLLELLEKCYRFPDRIEQLQNYLDAWLRLPGLSPDLYPPQVSLSEEMFVLPHWKSPK